MADNNTIARPYARAAFELASEKKDLSGWAAALDAAKDLLADGRVAKFLANPALSDEQEARVPDWPCSSQPTVKTQCLVAATTRARIFSSCLLEYGRVSVLPEIAEHFDALKAAVENTVDVTVTSAAKMSAAQEKTVAAALEKRLGRNVNLSTEIDENLIGGAVIRAGDVVIDGSLRARLEGLANALTA